MTDIVFSQFLSRGALHSQVFGSRRRSKAEDLNLPSDDDPCGDGSGRPGNVCPEWFERSIGCSVNQGMWVFPYD